MRRTHWLSTNEEGGRGGGGRKENLDVKRENPSEVSQTQQPWTRRSGLW